MKNQALFSSKDKSKKLKCHLLQFLFGALRVNGENKAIHLLSTWDRAARVVNRKSDISAS